MGIIFENGCYEVVFLARKKSKLVPCCNSECTSKPRSRGTKPYSSHIKGICSACLVVFGHLSFLWGRENGIFQKKKEVGSRGVQRGFLLPLKAKV